jgi:cell division protein FtsZ
VIKVVGVGGAGGNAVDHMIREGVSGVEFICCNTDAQALKKSNADVKLQLGPGLGAGGKPEKARELAMQDRERIADALRGAHMVFITAGMGGGTGTGAGPVVAEVAQDLGILTVAVVTKPFEYEGRRKRVAEEGVNELAKHVDSLIVILNEKLEEVLGEEISYLEAFKTADNVLRNAVGGIAEIINVPGLVNVDFEDVRTVMHEMGKAMMGSAVAAGVDRARIAAEGAVASPLLEGIELSGARGVLVNITASSTLGPQGVQGGDEDHPPIHGARGHRDLRYRVRRRHGRPAARHRGRHRLWVSSVATGGRQAGHARGRNHGPAHRHGQSFRYSKPAAMAPAIDLSSVTSERSQFGTCVIRRRKRWSASGVDKYDIPAFLRRQSGLRGESMRKPGGRAPPRPALHSRPGCGGAKHASRNPASPSRPVGLGMLKFPLRTISH